MSTLGKGRWRHRTGSRQCRRQEVQGEFPLKKSKASDRDTSEADWYFPFEMFVSQNDQKISLKFHWLRYPQIVVLFGVPQNRFVPKKLPLNRFTHFRNHTFFAFLDLGTP